MTNRELETRYMRMKLTWKNLVNANVELVDENKYLKEEIERLNNIINELEKDLKGKIDEDRLNILSNSHWKYILDKLQELKGDGK